MGKLLYISEPLTLDRKGINLANLCNLRASEGYQFVGAYNTNAGRPDRVAVMFKLKNEEDAVFTADPVDEPVVEVSKEEATAEEPAAEPVVEEAAPKKTGTSKPGARKTRKK